MNAGKLRHRITIQQLTTSQDATTGAMTETWSTFGTVWAAFEPLSVKEFIASAATQAQISARVTVRYMDGILPTMRVVHSGKTYNIEGVLPDLESGKEYLTLPVSEVPDG